MRQTSLIAIRASHRRWTDALHARRVVGNGTLYVKLIDIDVGAFLLAHVIRVLNSRAQELADGRRDSLFGKQHRVHRMLYLLPLDEVQHETRFLRRHSLE